MNDLIYIMVLQAHKDAVASLHEELNKIEGFQGAKVEIKISVSGIPVDLMPKEAEEYRATKSWVSYRKQDNPFIELNSEYFN